MSYEVKKFKIRRTRLVKLSKDVELLASDAEEAMALFAKAEQDDDGEGWEGPVLDTWINVLSIKDVTETDTKERS